MTPLNLLRDDLRHIMNALELAASRRESMVRANCGAKRGSNGKHAAQAVRMREIRAKLLHTLKENPGERDFHIEPRP